MTDIQFPIKYYENNILFNQENEAWAYYELIGYEYDYLSENKKAAVATRLESLFAQIKVETHLLVLPKFHSVREIHDQFKRTIKGPLKEAAIWHTEQVAPLVEEAVGAEPSDYYYYFGVKLPKEENTKLTLSNIKDAIKDMFNEIFSKMGLEEQDIQNGEIERIDRLEKMYEKIINTHITTRRINENDFQWLIRRNFYRGIGLPPHVKDFRPKYHKTKNGRQPMDILKLTEGIVDAKSNLGELVLSQAAGGGLKTGHCAFLTISYMPTDGLFNIGTEWIYATQSLDFPVETSIRTDSIEHRKVMAMVRNKKKELRDQDEHAASTNNETSYEVTENVVLARELETFTNITKMPQLNVSIVLCVSADSKDQLRSRIRSLQDLYADFKFQLEQPISDQFKLFNEFIPGAKRYVTSYVQMMEPAALAAGMFGATTQIGDSTGFCIGLQGRKAIYLNPFHYTQGVTGSKSRAISADFIGSKGSGKSYGANLVAVLTVMCGGRALIIDPKGDRTYWKETLPDIGHEVNVITLEATPENKGRLDPFLICDDLKQAESLALRICVYLTKINQQKERAEWIAIRQAVGAVTAQPYPCMEKVLEKLLDLPKDEPGYEMGTFLATYKDLSFASLIFGDGEPVQALDIDNSINVLQIQNLKMPAKNKKSEDFDMEEMLSMAMMFPIGEFAFNFIHQDRSILKIAFFDESWFMEKTDIGKDILGRVLREGRAMNAGLFRATQGISDVDEETKSLVGLKFVFQNMDATEAANSIRYLGIEPTEQLIEMVQSFKPGQCLMQDIYGRTGVVQLHAWFNDFHRAFDTRPPIDKEYESANDEKDLVYA